MTSGRERIMTAVIREQIKDYQVGDRIECVFDRVLKRTAFNLSSRGYGVAVIGFRDIEDHVLTVTAVPEKS
jgi:hypothetical protein